MYCVLLGGYDRGECLKTVEAFDLQNNTWSSLPSMLFARGRFEVAQTQVSQITAIQN